MMSSLSDKFHSHRPSSFYHLIVPFQIHALSPRWENRVRSHSLRSRTLKRFQHERKTHHAVQQSPAKAPLSIRASQLKTCWRQFVCWQSGLVTRVLSNWWFELLAGVLLQRKGEGFREAKNQPPPAPTPPPSKEVKKKEESKAEEAFQAYPSPPVAEDGPKDYPPPSTPPPAAPLEEPTARELYPREATTAVRDFWLERIHP